MVDLKNMTLNEMKIFFQGLEEKSFRAEQVFKWIYDGANSFDEMTNLSKELRLLLKDKAYIYPLKILRLQKSKEDGTRKYLFELMDGNTIESVFMKYKHGNSVCISSQVGCKMGCSFCASTIGGKTRNLTASEMVSQVTKIIEDIGERISNVVVMGIGEPFDNYDNLSKFIDIISAEKGLGLGKRNITISTCGLIPEIKKIGEDFPQVNLAISLHAPNDKIRKEIMPVANKYSMEELLSACKAHVNKTGRRITFEYALIDGVNDGEHHIKELAHKLKGMICHVNLIPLNRVDETGLISTNKKGAIKIKEYLEKENINVTIRRELGTDIDAACGQLRNSNK